MTGGKEGGFPFPEGNHFPLLQSILVDGKALKIWQHIVPKEGVQEHLLTGDLGQSWK